MKATELDSVYSHISLCIVALSRCWICEFSKRTVKENRLSKLTDVGDRLKVIWFLSVEQSCRYVYTKGLVVVNCIFWSTPFSPAQCRQ